MQLLRIVWLVALLPTIVGQIGSSQPGCALHCWENTKYVSKCLVDDDACLCAEEEYQKSLYQCLYSQCDTAHFGPALHHVISRCSESGNPVLFTAPPMPNRDELRRREEEYVAGEKHFGSGSAGYPMGSVLPFPTQSANLPTQSAGYATQSANNPWFPESTNSPVPIYAPQGAVMLPPVTSSTPTAVFDMVSPTLVPEVLPEIFMGSGHRNHNTIAAVTIITLLVLCFVA